jgi:hypothetical protein
MAEHNTAELVRFDDPVEMTERVAVAAFWPATPAPHASVTRRICGSSPAGATTPASVCSACNERTLSCSPVGWNNKVG